MLGGVARPWTGQLGEGSPTGRVCWAGPLVTQSFWERAGYPGTCSVSGGPS